MAIAFDAASNSGDQAASSNYTFSRTVGSGASRFLRVDVALLATTDTVTSVTDDDGGGNVPLLFIGAINDSTVGRIEMWGLSAPVTGTKTIRVILGNAVESCALAVSYTGVNQGTPTESFNSASGSTGLGGSNQPSVDITTTTDNDWGCAALFTTDFGTSTAGQTARNNVHGVTGSGANEDTNGVVHPAGLQTMTYTVGNAKGWAIAGYGLVPIGPTIEEDGLTWNVRTNW